MTEPFFFQRRRRPHACARSPRSPGPSPRAAPSSIGASRPSRRSIAPARAISAFSTTPNTPIRLAADQRRSLPDHRAPGPAAAPPRSPCSASRAPYRAFVAVCPRAVSGGAAALLAVRGARRRRRRARPPDRAPRERRHDRSRRRDRTAGRDRGGHRDRRRRGDRARTCISAAIARSEPGVSIIHALDRRPGDHPSRLPDRPGRLRLRDGAGRPCQGSADRPRHHPGRRRDRRQHDDRSRGDERHRDRRGHQDRQSRPDRPQCDRSAGTAFSRRRPAFPAASSSETMS